MLYFRARVERKDPQRELIRVIEEAGFRERGCSAGKISTTFIIFERASP